jgi:hypothetical protein
MNIKFVELNKKATSKFIVLKVDSSQNINLYVPLISVN